MQPIADIHQVAGLKQLASRDEQAALKEAAKQFEALFVQMVIKQMREASLGDPLLGNSQGQLYRELYDQQLALHLAKQSGLGIADMLVAQLEKPGSERSSADDRATALQSPEVADSSRADNAPVGEIGSSDGVLMEQQAAFEALRPSAHSTAPAPLPGRFKSAEDFVRSLWPEAQRAAADIGLDPRLLLAQAALETGWGQKIIHHPDGRSSHNLFNIKAAASWPGEEVQVSTLEYQEGIAVKKRAAFRAYENYRQSFEDYLKLIKSPRYAEVLSSTEDPRRYLTALQQAGYATDPNYADKVLTIYRHETLAAL